MNGTGKFIPQAARPSSRAALCVIERFRHRTRPCRSALDASSIQGAREEPSRTGRVSQADPPNYFTQAFDEGPEETPPLGRTSGGVFFGAPPAGESASYPPGNTPSGLDPSPSFVLSDFTRRTSSASFCGRGDEPTWLNALRNWPASVSGNFIGSSGAGGQPRMGTPLQEKRPPALIVETYLARRRSLRNVWRRRVRASRVYVLGRFSVFEARNPCAVASFSHM
jgi:hypothetical protein